MFAGIVLLAVAAVLRLDGPVLVPASLLMLDVRRFVGDVRRFKVPAVAAAILAAVIGGAQFRLLTPGPLSIRQMGTPHLGLLEIFGGDVLDEFAWSPAFIQKERRPPAPTGAHLAHAGLSSFSFLMMVGAVAGMFSRRRRLGLGALFAVIPVLAPVAGSGVWILPLRRLVPTSALQSIVAGVGLEWLMSPLARRTKLLWAPALAGACVALVFWIPARKALGHAYFFNDEYDMVRTALAPGGTPRDGCALFTYGFEPPYSGLPGPFDVDIEFPSIVPGMQVFQCHDADCLGQLANLGCHYYMPSVSCYVKPPAAKPTACALEGTDASGDVKPCLAESCASIERNMRLEAVDVRRVRVRDALTIPPDFSPWFAHVGLFRVLPPGK
jgi:hypothetical protein